LGVGLYAGHATQPYINRLTARVSTAWTISRPLSLHAGVGVRACGGRWDHTQTTAAAAAYQLSHPL